MWVSNACAGARGSVNELIVYFEKFLPEMEPTNYIAAAAAAAAAPSHHQRSENSPVFF